ncbi:hypothetical protein B6U74_02625 [Candidatus Bathyarchaeota archaeon ex4484_205]|nr:MAG: hypothetical protein B6U74_02625 [Candidatus Bathyarchaeota archaeon ex4484_205]RLG66654.1 MAG: hypothetical protein DRN93_05975 [archaeon]
MVVDLNLKGGRIFIAGELHEGGLSIDEGKIVKVGKEKNLPESSQTLHLNGQIICPGFIDVHVHLRGGEEADKEDFESGLSAAAAGGVTTVLDMPNTNPPLSSLTILKRRILDASRSLYVNLGFYGLLNEKSLPHINDLKKFVKAFKAYLYSPNERIQIKYSELEEFYEKMTNSKIVVHAEDPFMINLLLQKKRLKDRKGTLLDVISSHPPEAEYEAVSRVLSLHIPKNTLHFAHISYWRSVNKIWRNGKRPTMEATPHHLFLSLKAIERFGSKAYCIPPLRRESDRIRLLTLFQAGFIDILASDHAPHTIEDKERFPPSPGFPGLETMVSLALHYVNRGILTLDRVVESLSSNPARIFKLGDRGAIKEGYVGDLTIIDLSREVKIDPSTFYSKSKFSPFEDMRVKGVPYATIVGGEIVMMEGEVYTDVKPGSIIRG